MDQLFLIEILVDTIRFTNADQVPTKKQINIVATFVNFATLEFRHDGIGGKEESSKTKVIDFSTGKSHLFPCNAENLYKALSQHPLEILVFSKASKSPTPIGKATVKWTEEFTEMVNYSRDGVGYISPASLRESVPMYDGTGKETGSIEVFLRLSCFGQSIQTQFQIMKLRDAKEGAPKTQFLFKSTNAATTFQCQRFGLGTSAEALPVGPVYNALDMGDKHFESVFPGDSRLDNQYSSLMPSAFDFNFDKQIGASMVEMSQMSRRISDDIQSINIRLPESCFYNLESMLENAATTTKKKFKDEDLTAENINKMLCKNKDCPAAKKFKEFGLGPLATGKGLGTIYGDVQPPVSYGLTHVNGSMDRYGPYGVYRKPKRADLPFEAKNSPVDVSKVPSAALSYKSSNRSTCCCCKTKEEPLRLTGGAALKNPHKLPWKSLVEDFQFILNGYKKALEDSSHCCKHKEDLTADLNRVFETYKQVIEICEKSAVPKTSCNDDGPLSLTVGASMKDDETSFDLNIDDTTPLRLTGGAPMDENERPSPLNACKGLMEDFDKVLEAYKKALGPCGQATCPFAQNLVAETCKKFCPAAESMCPPGPARMVVDNTPDGKDSISTCGMPSCPYARDMTQPVEEEIKLKQLKSACGEPLCPYAKKRLGVQDEDTDEVTCQLAALPKTCGIPKCPYENQPELPPIHWDCPDPLPKGPCKNPSCPIMKLKNLAAGIFQAPQSPCKCQGCPYATPPPCDFPGCPFGLPKPCTVPGCPFSAPTKCVDPSCPVNAKSSESDTESLCNDPNCPYMKLFGKERKVVEGDSSGSSIEVVTGDNIEPCTPNTCSAKGGTLDCEECGGGGTCPCSAGYSDDGNGGDTELTVGDNLEPCTPHTCAGKGGDLVCDECGARTTGAEPKSNRRRSSVQQPSPPANIDKDVKRKSQSASAISDKKETTQKASASDKALTRGKRSRKRRSKFVYDTGDTYPGVKIGHRECLELTSNVPHNMGWLWNIKPPGRLRPRRGWKPGALTKTMAAIIEKHRLASGLQPLVTGQPQKQTKKKRRINAYGVYESDSDVPVVPKPTLQIKKKDGCYLITMNPLKDPNTLEDNENPYMDCTPMQFKITKNKPPIQIRNGEEGEDSYCCCCDDENQSTSSDSELDIEFTPPAGIIHPDKLRKKKNVVHIDTQYNEDDLPKDETLQLSKKGDKKGKGGKGGKGKGGKGGKGKGKGKKKK